MKNRTKRIVSMAMAPLVSMLVLIPAFAIERVNTPQNSCATIQNIIQRDGAAILRYPSKNIANYTLYDRYVAGNRFCKRDERVKATSVPSRDQVKCRVYLCKPYEPLFERNRRRLFYR